MSGQVVVVGGGLAGLSAAYDLVRSGAQVVVLDAADRPGGKVRRETVAGVALDVGAESSLAVRPELVELASELGLGNRLVLPTTTNASVWSRGRLHPLPAGTVMGVPRDPAAAAGLLTPEEVARAVDERPWPGPHATDVSVGEYVAARLGDAVVDRLVEPLLGGVYAGDARRISLRAATPSLWPVVETSGSLLAAVKVATPVGGTRVGSPFVGLEGGIGTLADALVEAVRAGGGEVRTHTIGRELRRVGAHWQVVGGPVPAPEVLDADAVVVAVPPAAAGRVLAPHLPGPAAAALARIDTASLAIVTLAFDRDALGDLAGSGFLVPPIEGLTAKAATFSSAKWGWLDRAGADTAYLRASVGRAGDPTALQQPDGVLVDAVLADLSTVLGRSVPSPVDRQVQRWGGALPQYAVGHLDRVAAIRAGVAGLPGVEVAGAAYDGVGLPAVIGTGRAAARAIATHLGLGDFGHE